MKIIGQLFEAAGVDMFYRWAIIIGILLFAAAALADTRQYPAKIIECHDGDTCTFDIMLGLRTKATRDVRICDIDTPELSGPDRQAALDAKHWISSRLFRAEKITLVVGLKRHCEGNDCERYTFRRLLADIIADGSDVGQEMLKNGLAKESIKRCLR